MTIQESQKLLRKLIQAKDEDELQKIVASNVMWCDGIFFAELERFVEMYTERGDKNSAHKLKELGDYMARLRFMI